MTGETIFETAFFTSPAGWERGVLSRPAVGTTFRVCVAAPGIGHYTYRVVGYTLEGDVRAVLVGSNVRELTRWDVQ